jgi:hypothetical protein
MKNFKIILLFFCILMMVIITNTYADKVYVYDCNRHNDQKDNGNVDRVLHSYTQDESPSGIIVVTHHIDCYDPGNTVCPQCNMTISSNDNGPLDQEFLDESADTMYSYVFEQIGEENLSGSQSFNVYVDNIYIYRNVTWNYVDSVGTINMRVFPYIVIP